MGAPIRIVHDKDPADEIREDVGHICDGIQVLGADVLLVMYERIGQRETKTAGGIFIPEVKGGAATEDKYQGKVGLVMALGDIAFQDDDSHQWGAAKPKVGDWVLVNVNETYSFDLPVYPSKGMRVGTPTGQRRARIVQDVYVRGIVSKDVFDAIW